MPIADKLVALIAKMPVPVVSIVGRLLAAIMSSDDPKAAASRALEEAARGTAFDEALRKRSKKVSKP